MYDPKHFNDRLVLGLKGTMSEAELHMLKGRLRGGILSEARRGELKTPLPVGFVYDERDNVVLDPDAQVREPIRLLFRTFARTGSAYAAVKTFRDEKVLFPDAHVGYISLQEYEDNQRRLLELAQAHGKERYRSPPREGPALLQGLVVCGACGNRVGIHHHIKNRRVVPEYVCQKAGIEHAGRFRQRMMGDGVDEAVGQLVVESMNAGFG